MPNSTKQKIKALQKLRSKPFLKNADGSRSSEKTQTVKVDGNFINVPTIDPERRMSLSTKEGIKTEMKRTGNNPKTFESLEAALKGAKKRSASGGRDRKKKT